MPGRPALQHGRRAHTAAVPERARAVRWPGHHGRPWTKDVPGHHGRPWTKPAGDGQRALARKLPRGSGRPVPRQTPASGPLSGRVCSGPPAMAGDAQAGPDSRGPEGTRPIPGVAVTVPRTRHLLACWPLCRWRWPPSRDTGKTAARDLRAQTCPRGQPGTSTWHRWLAGRSRPGRGRASALLRRQAAEVQPAPGSGRGGPAPVTL